MPGFPHERLTPEQHASCDSFHLKVFGTPMFPTGPVCNGKHGWGCTACWVVLKAEEDARAVVVPIRQPWELRMAA
jgi:hypothetical protein